MPIHATGWFRTIVFYNFFLANIIFLKKSKTQSYFEGICMDILIFCYLDLVRWKKSCISESCLNIIIAPFQLISIMIELWTNLWTYLSTSDIPKYHPDTPQTPLHTPLHIPDTNRHQQTPTDTNRHHTDTLKHSTTRFGGVWQCLPVSGDVCCCLLVPETTWGC